MAGTRTPPTDQEAFASILLALRAFADGGPAQNDFERTVIGQLQASDTKEDFASQLVANFDRLVPAMRQRALGSFGQAGFVPQPRRAPAGAGQAPASASPFVIRPPDFAAEAIGPTGTFVDPANPPDNQVFQYGIRYVGFHCDEEVGDPGDFLVQTSDEVYVVTSAVSINRDGTNTVTTTKHPIDRDEYGDVDIGETRLGPVAQCWQGTDFPVSLTAVAYERDFGDPDKYRDEIDAAVKAAIAVGGYLFGAGAPTIVILEFLSTQITDLINWLIDTDDDQVDIARTAIMDQLFVEVLGRKGPSRHIHKQRLPFGGEIEFQTPLVSHFTTRHSGLGGRYVFGFDLERNPPFVEAPDVVD
jgi:hypothetical protein